MEQNNNNTATDQDSFAALYKEEDIAPAVYQPGQKLEAKVIRIGREWIFIDLGGKSEGSIDRKELEDKEGGLPVEEGDLLEVFFLGAKQNEKIFTTKISGGKAAQSHLEDAYAGGIPVEGTVSKEIKGGFEISVAGSTRAFCPYSQIDLQRSEEPAKHIGNQYTFKIIEFKEGGRNIILSRRAILEEEQKNRLARLREELAEGMLIKGVITSIRDFGAFVNVGGIEGLIPISEISWSRVDDVASSLAVGQEVEVEILKLDWERSRFSFSLKRAGQDPWSDVEKKYPPGAVFNARITRLATFGAFAELEPGVEGLIPISFLGGGRRLKHASEVLKENDTVELRIDKVKPEERRLTLVPVNLEHFEKEGAEKPKKGKNDKPSDERSEYETYLRDSSKTGQKSLGTLGDLLRKKLS